MPDPVTGTVIGSAVIGGYSANKAAKTQAKAAQEGIDAQERMFERQVELQQPWREAGVNALARLQQLAPYQQFGEAQFRADPGYAFRLSEGMKALERSRAAGGNLLSGGTIRAGQRYAQDLASQEYGNAFNRYQAERAATLQPYQSLAGIGQTAANTLTGAAGQLGQGQAAGYGQMGSALASGYMGTANALAGAGSQYLGYQQNQALLNALRNQQSSYPIGYTVTNPYVGQAGAGYAGGGIGG